MGAERVDYYSEEEYHQAVQQEEYKAYQYTLEQEEAILKELNQGE